MRFKNDEFNFISFDALRLNSFYETDNRTNDNLYGEHKNPAGTSETIR